MAVALSKLRVASGRALRVGLMDADIYGPSVPLLMKLRGLRAETNDGALQAGTRAPVVDLAAALVRAQRPSWCRCTITALRACPWAFWWTKTQQRSGAGP